MTSIHTTSIPNQKTKRNHVQTCPEKNKGFEAPELVDDEAKKDAGCDGKETVEGRYAESRFCSEVEGDEENGVEKVCLHRPGCL
jgi:hypothetical protein